MPWTTRYGHLLRRTLHVQYTSAFWQPSVSSARLRMKRPRISDVAHGTSIAHAQRPVKYNDPSPPSSFISGDTPVVAFSISTPSGRSSFQRRQARSLQLVGVKEVGKYRVDSNPPPTPLHHAASPMPPRCVATLNTDMVSLTLMSSLPQSVKFPPTLEPPCPPPPGVMSKLNVDPR